mmetsp:Transcript_83177/g.182761  ORF Transcript_83177/g.182761 Transcript_83177/m.182761 type:complete len:232 (-) Transcript_83177:76-771(-)
MQAEDGGKQARGLSTSSFSVPVRRSIREQSGKSDSMLTAMRGGSTIVGVSVAVQQLHEVRAPWGWSLGLRCAEELQEAAQQGEGRVRGLQPAIAVTAAGPALLEGCQRGKVYLPILSDIAVVDGCLEREERRSCRPEVRKLQLDPMKVTLIRRASWPHQSDTPDERMLRLQDEVAVLRTDSGVQQLESLRPASGPGLLESLRCGPRFHDAHDAEELVGSGHLAEDPRRSWS